MPRKPAKSAELKRLLASLKTLASKPLKKAQAMPAAVYTSDELYDLERSRIFNKQWLCAGFAGDLPNAGDYLSYRIGEQPIVIIRQKDGSIAAFANVCRHRMMQLVEGKGNCKHMVCPYHAWTYDIDGRLVVAPHMQERVKSHNDNLSLSSVRCEVWEGWIYVTLNPKAKPVATALRSLHKIVSDYRMADYVPIVQRDHVWRSNWKLLCENFMEGYHLPVAHKATVGPHIGLGDTKFPKRFNRAFTYQLYTKGPKAPVGNAHPDNTRLKGDQRHTSVLPTIFPSHMISLAPDHLWYLTIQPKGTGEIQIRYGAALAPEVMAANDNKDELIDGIVDFLDHVNEEDRFVVEGIYKGAKASLSSPGPLCWLEHENHDFTKYIASQLC
ncbi:MAG: SRPBCC family protein [Pseudomonadota bacterium]